MISLTTSSGKEKTSTDSTDPPTPNPLLLTVAGTRLVNERYAHPMYKYVFWECGILEHLDFSGGWGGIGHNFPLAFYWILRTTKA